jgi:hypothetical protein
MLSGRTVAGAAGRYLRRHPEELGRALRSALGLRLGVPVAAFRWLVEQTSRDPADADVEIEPHPPGLRLSGTFENMQTRLRGSAVVFIDRIEIDAQRIRIDLRLEQVRLRVLSERKTHLSALVKSGALDLSRPGNLVAELPGMPPFIVDAHDNVVGVDLMRDPKLGRNRMVVHAVGLLSSLVTVHAIETDSTHLDVLLRALPRGLGAAADAVEEHVVEPGFRRLRRLIGGRNRVDEGSRRAGWRRMLGWTDRVVA